MRIPGRWREGYTLDFHTVSSVYVGDDQFGHPRFETTRTEVGDLLYRLKYSQDKTSLPELVATAADFVSSWKPSVDLLVPVPPSRNRPEQPLLLVAVALAEATGLAYDPDCIRKRRDVAEQKDINDFDQRVKLLEGAFESDTARGAGRRILLFDDLFRSGATLNTLAALLYDDGRAADVYALTLTRTRSNR